jgi:hypothetical protein
MCTPCLCPCGHLYSAMDALPLQIWQDMGNGKPRPPPLTNLPPPLLENHNSNRHDRRSGLSAGGGASSATGGASTHGAASRGVRARITASTHSLANVVKAALHSMRSGGGSAPSGRGANVYGPEPHNNWAMTAATGSYVYMAPEVRGPHAGESRGAFGVNEACLVLRRRACLPSHNRTVAPRR